MIKDLWESVASEHSVSSQECHVSTWKEPSSQESKPPMPAGRTVVTKIIKEGMLETGAKDRAHIHSK